LLLISGENGVGPFMNRNHTIRSFLSLAIVPIFAGILFAQSTGDKTLVVNGKTATSPVRLIDGRSYVDLETLAEVTNGVFTVEANRVLLTIPTAPATDRTVANPAPAVVAAQQNQQVITRDFAAAAISELAEMREYRGTIRAMITYGLAVSEAWAQQYQEQVLVGLRQAEVAATTDADRNALQLLHNEADKLNTWASGVYAARQALNGASTVDPNALLNDPALAKIHSCGQFLNSMIVSRTFTDDPVCH
jgi:hypothetical protein